MCFVGFVYFACGHKRIIINDCDVARELDVPFFIRSQCENYAQKSEWPSFACGTGRFYCSETPDGPFLDHLHASSDQAKVDLERIAARMATVETAAQNLTTTAHQHGVPMALRMQIPQFRLVQAEHVGLSQQRFTQQQTLDQTVAIIEQARNYHTTLRGHAHNVRDMGAYPPFVPSANLFGKVPAEMATMYDTRHSVEKAHNYTQYAQRQPGGLPRPTPIPKSSASSNVPRRNPNHAAVLRHQSTLSNVQSHTSIEDPPVETTEPPTSVTRKRGRLPKQQTGQGRSRRGRKAIVEDEDTAEENRNTIRRSTRARKKDVKYVVDGSEESCEPSPDKSDISGFSPSKSDRDESVSPSKSARGRLSTRPEPQKHASSLSERLSDLARRRGIGSDTPPTQSGALPGIKDILKPSPRQDTPLAAQSLMPPPRTASGTPQLNRLPPMRSPTDPATMSGALLNLSSLATLLQSSQARAGMQPKSVDLDRYFAEQTAQRSASNATTLASAHPQITPGPSGRVDGVYGQNAARSAFSHPQPLTPHISTPSLHRNGVPTAALSLFAPGTHPFSFRRDSFTSYTGGSPVAQSIGPATPSMYDDMKRSLSAGVTLNPSTVPSEGGEANQPRKRNMSSASNDVDGVKRVRLSLPGEENAEDARYGAEWMSQHAAHGCVKSPAGDGIVRTSSGLDELAEVTSTSAMMGARTAVMSAAKTGGENEDDGHGGQETSLRPFCGDGAEHEGQVYSDQIDWGDALYHEADELS